MVSVLCNCDLLTFFPTGQNDLIFRYAWSSWGRTICFCLSSSPLLTSPCKKKSNQQWLHCFLAGNPAIFSLLVLFQYKFLLTENILSYQVLHIVWKSRTISRSSFKSLTKQNPVITEHFVLMSFHWE